jgi:hypothetical protein
MAQDPSLRPLPDGTWEETRYEFARGDLVRVLYGSLEGHFGTIQARVFSNTVDDPKRGAGYQVELDDGRLALLRWDQVG